MSIDTSSARLCATAAASHPARSSGSAPGPLSVSPTAPHPENPASDRAALRSTGLGRDAAHPRACRRRLSPVSAIATCAPGPPRPAAQYCAVDSITTSATSLSSLFADLIGPSARRMLRAIASGKTNPAAVAALGSRRLHATPDQLRDALGACTDLHPVYRRLLTLMLDELEGIERQIDQLDTELGALLRGHQSAVERLAAVPGLGVDSAQQIITEVGPAAATFATAKRLASWVGVCPGHDESAGINHSHRAPNGNRQMRRLLNQAANAAVKAKGSIFELVYRRLVIKLGHAQAIGAIAHRLCRLIWKILHDGVAYEERGPAVTKHRAQRRAAKMIRELRALGYRVEQLSAPASNLA